MTMSHQYNFRHYWVARIPHLPLLFSVSRTSIASIRDDVEAATLWPNGATTQYVEGLAAEAPVSQLQSTRRAGVGSKHSSKSELRWVGTHQ